MLDLMWLKTGIVLTFIFYGKNGEISTNRIDDQELSVLSLAKSTVSKYIKM